MRGCDMNFLQMTAPCGLDCFNCTFYIANEDTKAMKQVKQWSKELNIPVEIMTCRGCRNHNGQIPLQKHLFGEDHRCAAYECSKREEVQFCGQCESFPCDHLHPYADKASTIPHNTKVFNLCLINKMGVEEWAKSKAADVRETYFAKKWTLSE
jgi:hypothetical protein